MLTFEKDKRVSFQDIADNLYQANNKVDPNLSNSLL